MTERKGRILVVDDSDAILSHLSDVLGRGGYDVVTTSKTTGVQRVLDDCDLAVIDYHMPGVTGADLVQSLRKSMGFRERSCLLYLYTSDESVAAKYRTYGFDGALTSKGNDAALLAQVDAVFRIRALRSLAPRGPRR